MMFKTKEPKFFFVAPPAGPNDFGVQYATIVEKSEDDSLVITVGYFISYILRYGFKFKVPRTAKWVKMIIDKNTTRPRVSFSSSPILPEVEQTVSLPNIVDGIEILDKLKVPEKWR